MNFFKAYILGLKTAISYPRVLLTTYLLNVLLGGVFFLSAYTLFGGMASRSIEFEPLLKDFDFTVITDFLKYQGQPVKTLFALMLGLGVFNWLLNIFLSGGILSIIKLEKFSMRDFFGASGYNFFSFLFLDLLGWGIFLVLFGLLAGGSGMLFDTLKPENEAVSMQIGMGVAIVFGFFAIMSVSAMTYAKSMLVLDNSVNFLTKFFKGWVFTYTRFYVTVPLMLLLILGPAAVGYLYFKLEAMFHSGTMAGILIGFLIQQGFILLRVFFRIWILATHFEFYDRQFYQKKLAKKAAQSELPIQ